jgi:CDP-diacylglycerol--glycerol-3-phosphate 3-phosphatidyltransferase
MFFLEPRTLAFYIVYTVSGLSDAFDGTIARLTGNTSVLGARLDSIADLLFYAVMLFKILPKLIEILPSEIWYFVVAIIVIRIASYSLAAIRYHLFSSMHTYLNKLTGISLFLVPYFLVQNYIVGYCIAVCAIAGIASVEELLIHATKSSYDRDRKTLINYDFKKCCKK